jgi:hypothetical protein
MVYQWGYKMVVFSKLIKFVISRDNKKKQNKNKKQNGKFFNQK